jgi:pyrimidine-nucleoside phosphorylase
MDFQQAVENLKRNPDELAFDQLIALVRTTGLADAEIAELAIALATSGEIIGLNVNAPIADVASTGGASSLSTLLCPLFLRTLGACVPKLGVPGRPAGGIDVMAQLSDYSVIQSTPQIKAILDTCGYAHFLASDHHAPLDAKLFAHRKQKGATALVELAIASLLSKKIAVGLERVGLDVRVGPAGNFGTTWDEARSNSERFSRIASMLNMKAVCFLTDGKLPFQPFIGRGEGILALSTLLIGEPNSWLKQHARVCFTMAKATLGIEEPVFPDTADLLRVFQNNLTAQGANFSQFVDHAIMIQSAAHRMVVAPTSGFLEINLNLLREVIVSTNDIEDGNTQNPLRFPDRIGVTLQALPNAFVLRGEPIAKVRCNPDLPTDRWLDIEHAFSINSRGNEKAAFEQV